MSSSTLNDLVNLARDLTLAQTVAVFLPIEQSESSMETAHFVLGLSAHTSEHHLDTKHKTKAGCGIIGWVSQNKDLVKISPYKHSSRALGFYTSEVKVNSIVALPIELGETNESRICGVLYCDSPAEALFDQASAKHLKNIAAIMSRTINLEKQVTFNMIESLDLETFYQRTEKLLRQLGASSLEIMRIKLNNPQELEQETGLHDFLLIFQKMQRLIQQTLPRQFPVLNLPSGETLIVIDNMMANFYENKIRIIAAHASPENATLSYDFQRCSIKRQRTNSASEIFECLQHSSEETTGISSRNVLKAMFRR